MTEVGGLSTGTNRIVLLVTSPRLPAGLLTAVAWDLVRTFPVLAGAEGDLPAAIRAAGGQVRVVAPDQVPPDQVPAELVGTARAHGTAVWLAGAAPDPGLCEPLRAILAGEPEVLVGSWDPPGARLLDVVAVMDHLVSPGGDPWKQAQTHESLAGYLLEETYEAYDAMLAGDLAGLREELGDVLLQVVLHARMAQDGDPPWSVDDLAAELTAKLIRRNPHVFAGMPLRDLDEITASWEQVKRAEKARGSVLDGLARSQPALALAAKIRSRADRAGLEVRVPEPPLADVADEAALGELLLGIVELARRRGLDPEAALRRTALAHADALRAEEAAARGRPGPAG
jgi:NTP pyrophosphatase (non-canonical NTP hydrolase)